MKLGRKSLNIMKSIDNKTNQLQKTGNGILTPHLAPQNTIKSDDIIAIKTSYTSVIEKRPAFLKLSLLFAVLVILAIFNKGQLVDLFASEPEFQLKDVMGVTYYENGKKVNTVDNIDPKTRKWLKNYYQNKTN